jgi:predicted nucleotidyltransferase
MLNLNTLKTKINNICKTLPIKRLGIYGSALTDKFTSDSDVDVLVLFDTDKKIDYFDNYFKLKEQLEIIFKREVDLIIDKPFKNPIFNKSVEKSRLTIYER